MEVSVAHHIMTRYLLPLRRRLTNRSLQHDLLCLAALSCFTGPCTLALMLHHESFVSWLSYVVVILTAASSDCLKEPRTFFCSKRLPCSRGQSIKRDMHYTNPMKCEHPIPQYLAH